MKLPSAAGCLLVCCFATRVTAPAQSPPAGIEPLTPSERALLQSDDYRRRFLESYLPATDLEPAISQDERELLAEVIELEQAQKSEAAATLLRESLTAKSSARLDFILGNLHQQRGEFDYAAIAYVDAVDKFPKYRQAWQNLGQIHFQRGEFRSAVGAFAKVLEHGGGSPITYGLLGIAHGKIEEYVAAESAFRMAAMMDPRTLDWTMGLAESLFQQRRFADAASLFDTLIARHPERADLWELQGEAYAMLDQPLKAAEDFEMAERLGGAKVATLNNLGDIYANQQLFDLAVDAYLRALEKQPDAPVRRALRAAEYLAGNGAIDESRRLVDGIEGRPGVSLLPEERKELLGVRVRLALATGATEAEAAALKQLVELDPMDGDALILLGQHAGRTGNVEQAAYWFERAAGIEAFEASGKLRHGELLVKQQKYAEAIPLLRRALALQPNADVERYVTQVERLAQTKK